jgi:hypothetical protein
MPAYALPAALNFFIMTALGHIIAGIVITINAIELQQSESGISIDTLVFPNIVLPVMSRIIVGHRYTWIIMNVQFEERVVDEEVGYNLMF